MQRRAGALKESLSNALPSGAQPPPHRLSRLGDAVGKLFLVLMFVGFAIGADHCVEPERVSRREVESGDECSKAPLAPEAYDALKRFGADETGTIELGPGRPAVEIAEPLGFEAIVAVTQRVDDGIFRFGILHDGMPGVEVLILDAESPFREGDDGTCELNSLQISEAGPKVELRYPSDESGRACAVEGQRVDGMGLAAGLLSEHVGEITSVRLRESGRYYCFAGPMLNHRTPLKRDLSSLLQNLNESVGAASSEGGQGLAGTPLIPLVFIGALALVVIALVLVGMVCWALLSKYIGLIKRINRIGNTDLSDQYVRNISLLIYYHCALLWLWLGRLTKAPLFERWARGAFVKSRGVSDTAVAADEPTPTQLVMSDLRPAGDDSPALLMGIRLYSRRALVLIRDDVGEWLILERPSVSRLSVSRTSWHGLQMLNAAVWLLSLELYKPASWGAWFWWLVALFFSHGFAAMSAPLRIMHIRFRDSTTLRLRLPTVDTLLLLQWIQRGAGWRESGHADPSQGPDRAVAQLGERSPPKSLPAPAVSGEEGASPSVASEKHERGDAAPAPHHDPGPDMRPDDNCTHLASYIQENKCALESYGQRTVHEWMNPPEAQP